MLILTLNDNKEIDGYSMGDMMFFDGKITSKGHTPNQSMMIFFSLVTLLDGVGGLVKKNNRSYEFIGVDSSFSVLFKKENESISIFYKNKFIASMKTEKLVTSIYQDISNFIAGILDKNDIIYDDLYRALNDFNI